MNAAQVAVALLGAAMIVIGAIRVRLPWQRYRALRDQEANIARYEAWRGGLRDTGPTGASVAMELLRGQVRSSILAILTGVAFVLAALFVMR